MAKKYIDIASTTNIDDDTTVVGSDGSALTLTNTIRVLWDTTKSTHEILAALERAEAVIRKIANR